MMLLAHHSRLLQEQSAISAALIEERGYYSAPTWLDLPPGQFKSTQKRVECFPALLIPQWPPSGESPYPQARWDNPRVTLAGKEIRYDTPSGAKPRLDVPPRCRAGLSDPELDLWVTEGSKKADSLASAGIIAVSLPGVWSWRTPSVQADFDSIVFHGRRVVVAFDSDMLTKPKVRLAIVRFGLWLKNRQANTCVADWSAVLGVAS